MNEVNAEIKTPPVELIASYTKVVAQAINRQTVMDLLRQFKVSYVKALTVKECSRFIERLKEVWCEKTGRTVEELDSLAKKALEEAEEDDDDDDEPVSKSCRRLGGEVHSLRIALGNAEAERRRLLDIIDKILVASSYPEEYLAPSLDIIHVLDHEKTIKHEVHEANSYPPAVLGTDEESIRALSARVVKEHKLQLLTFKSLNGPYSISLNYCADCNVVVHV